MTDWTVSRKLDEIIEQNTQIILLMQMQIVSDTPNINLHNLEKVTLKAIAASNNAKDQIAYEKTKAALQVIKDREEKELADKLLKEKLKRESVLKEKNDEINNIINARTSNSAAYPDSYLESLDK